MDNKESKLTELEQEMLIHFNGKRGSYLNKAQIREVSKLLEEVSKQRAQEAYKAGQQSVYCGCYEIKDCTTFAEWLTKEELNTLNKE